MNLASGACAEGERVVPVGCRACEKRGGSLPQLVDEIARALRPLCDGGPRGLAGFEIVVVDDASTDATRSVLKDLAAVYPELRGVVLAVRRWASRRRRWPAFAPPGETGLRRWTPTCRTTRPTWYGSGTPCPAMTRRWAGG